MIWQFLENEVLTRVLLAEATERGTYSAISTFFRQEQLPVFTTVSSPLVAAFHSSGYKDAQGNESWWWGDQLAGKEIEANHGFTQRVPG
jgi:hypothetical protein